MTTNRIAAIVGGAVLFILGLFIGAAISGGPSVEEIDAAVGKRLESASTAGSARLDKIEADLAQLSADIGGKVDGIAGAVDTGAKAAADSGAKLGTDVAALGTTLQGAIEKAGADQKAALESGLAGLRGQISSAPPPAAATSGAEAAAPVASAPPPENGVSPGETAMLSDGALRVFVSRVDDASGSAHVRANGTDIVLAVGQSATVAGQAGECQVTLDALGGGKAALSGACGDALPAPDGTAPGTTVELTPGLRVFVSGVTDNGARIAVNGVETTTVAVGEGIDAKAADKSCRVTVEGVDRGRVALGYTCG